MVLSSPMGLCAYRYGMTALLLLCSLFYIPVLHAANKPVAEPVTDLRILVDVSGSMKGNDPKNLRRDALRLLIGMLPSTSRVGIWSFGQYVNMQVKPGFATPQWKNNARKEANKIHSRGLYTNIEDTLTKSSWDWRRPDPKWDRHMILLTDGMVDISKSKSKNKISRNKILGKILSELKTANVKVHTIALSAQADHKLLRKLAKQSDGWYESVDSADKLQRLFLRLFEKTTKMDSLPLEGNYFDVDKNISDMTLLVFRSKSGVATKIKRSDGKSFDKTTAPKNIEWYQDKSFDIITVHKPRQGKWQIVADIDKDNRVKVVTNLKLKVAPLPTNIIKDEKVTVKASLLTKEKLLDDKELLDLVNVNLHSKNQKGLTNQQQLLSTDIKGRYKAVIDGVNEVGDVEVIVRVNAPTFKRESRHAIKVHENPVNLAVSATADGLIIKVTENPQLLQTGTLQLALSLEGQPGAYYVLKDGAHSWKAVVDNVFAGKKITINASAVRIGNINFKSQLHGKLPDAMIPMPDPLTVWAEDSESGLVIRAILTENILQTGTLQLAYSLEDGDDTKPTIIKNKAANLWQQLLLPEHSGKALTVVAKGQGLNGDEFNKSYVVTIPEMTVKAVVIEEPQPENKEDAVEAVEAVENDGIEAAAPEEDKSSNLLFTISIIVLVNILVFGGGYFGYRYWKKRDKPLTEDFDDDDDTIAHKEDAAGDKKQENITNEKKNDTEMPATDAEVDSDSEEDFSSQRKQKPEPKNVDLEVEDTDEQTDLAADENLASAESDDGLLETASADDLPEFDMELDADDESESQEVDIEAADSDEVDSQDTDLEAADSDEADTQEADSEVSDSEVSDSDEADLVDDILENATAEKDSLEDDAESVDAILESAGTEKGVLEDDAESVDAILESAGAEKGVLEDAESQDADVKDKVEEGNKND